MNKFLATWLAPILVLSGCATIMGESSQTVPIKSQPSGAVFKIQDETGVIVQSGVTPANVSLPKGATANISAGKNIRFLLRSRVISRWFTS